MRNPVFLVFAVLAGLASASSMAQTAIAYQGELLDDSGPANGPVAMEFVLYEDEAGTDLPGP